MVVVGRDWVGGAAFFLGPFPDLPILIPRPWGDLPTQRPFRKPRVGDGVGKFGPTLRLETLRFRAEHGPTNGEKHLITVFGAAAPLFH